MDNTLPTVATQNISVTLVNGAATISESAVNNGSTDNCTSVSGLTYDTDVTSFDCTDIGQNTVMLTVTDACGNSSTGTAIVTVLGSQPDITGMTVTPANTTNTGGVPTNLYIGYGPQSATMSPTVATPGTGLSYSWSPSGNLSCSTCATPVFTPTPASAVSSPAPTYTLTVSNSNGCVNSEAVTFCVKDIRVPGPTPARTMPKVYMCHSGVTTPVATNMVSSHQAHGDLLGQCGSTCPPLNARGIASNEEQEAAQMAGEQALEMVVYPNPSNSEFHLIIESTSTEKRADVTVFDLSGRIVERTANTATNSEVVVGKNLSPGVYFIEVKQGDLSKKIKAVKL
jgi:hypothetical protein